MKKRCLTMLLVLALAGTTLAGCAGKKAAKEEKKQSEVEEKEPQQEQEEETKKQEETKEEEENKEKEEKENVPADSNGIKVAPDDSSYSTSFSEKARTKEKPYTNKIKMCGKGEVGFNGNLRGWDIEDESTENRVILTNGMGATAEIYDSKIDIGDKEKIKSFLKEYKEEHYTMEFFQPEEGSEDAGDGFEGITYGGAKIGDEVKEIAFLVPVKDDHYLMVSVEDTSKERITTMDVFETLILGMNDLAFAGGR
ncbi:MAG: hypothetical protein II080_00980 [Lachnospiraceae bacterium]|nr:hypothetical protein [Lachnospiraceae bacterium]